MKSFLLFLALVFSALCYSQDFMGVKPEGTPAKFIASFKEKGFVLSSNENNVVVMKGKLGGTSVEVFGLFTPLTHQCWKLAVFMPQNDNWYRLKSEYNEYFDMLVSKYGSAKKTYNFFSSPYYEGDGYELTALAIEKCHYYAYWETTNPISIKISTTKQVVIGYENSENATLDDKESNNINQKAF